MRAKMVPPRGCVAAARGQAMVEFAFTSLMVLALLAATIDLGRAVFVRAALANAIREAARYGSLHPADPAGMVVAASRRTATPRLGSADFTATATYDRITCRTRTVGTGGQIVWVARNCASAGPRDRLSVCAEHRFVLLATRPFGLEAIAMRECAVVGIQ